MSVPPKWDKYEAVILLDAWLKVKEGIPKMEMINLVSFQLRQKALNQGVKIDNIYRNTNGISFQLMSMATAYEKQDMGKSASKLFNDIAELYRNDYESYEKILMEAIQMIEYSSDTKDNFMRYVSEKQPKLATEILHAVKCIEDFAISTKVLSHSIFEDLSEEIITILRKKVLNHKFFTVRFKNVLPYARFGLQMLNDYITERAVISNEQHTETQITESNTDSLSADDEQDNILQNNLYQEAEGFFNWMIQNSNLSMNTSRSYNSAVNTCDTYAKQEGIFQNSIRNCSSYSEFEEKYNLLMKDSGFRKLSKKNHNHLVAALNKYRDYMISVSTGTTPIPQTSYIETVPVELGEKYSAILMQEFEDGYCIGDYMHRMRFKSAYEEKYSEELDKDGDELDILLEKIGQIRDDRIFYVNTNNNTLLSSVYADISEAFSNGATAVYYECLYEKYSNKLATELSIYSANTLKTVMLNDSKFLLTIYQFERSAITMQGINADTDLEIKKILQNNHEPMTADDIKAKLWYVPISTIKLALVQIPEAAHVGNGTYFYAPNFYLSADEKITLIRAMRSAISSKGYIGAKDLREIFKNACPSSAMDSEQFKDYSIREILKVLLQEEFEFSSVITEKGNQLDYSQVFQNYAAERERLTLGELQELKKELGLPGIYWDSVFKEMIRISDTELVRKGTVQFNVSAIDEVLEQMYQSEYTALKDIDLFLSFPPVNVRWNGFVLESYLREYSEKFRLVQLSIAQDDYFGVMLKRSSDLENYNDVAADMLARNNSWSDEKSALQLLKDMKFQQRAKSSNISTIIKAAKQKRINLD
ncbi:MAG: hypothetical protein HDT22_05080 [Ruminococcus sp.]|nr:hypothetical protein [Ruminococcus sp.]